MKRKASGMALIKPKQRDAGLRGGSAGGFSRGSPAPFVHATDDSTAIEFRVRYRAFVDAFRCGAQCLRDRARAGGHVSLVVLPASLAVQRPGVIEWPHAVTEPPAKQPKRNPARRLPSAGLRPSGGRSSRRSRRRRSIHRHGGANDCDASRDRDGRERKSLGASTELILPAPTWGSMGANLGEPWHVAILGSFSA